MQNQNTPANESGHTTTSKTAGKSELDLKDLVDFDLEQLLKEQGDGKRVSTTVSIDSSLLELARKRAKENGLSLSAQVVIWIKEEINKSSKPCSDDELKAVLAEDMVDALRVISSQAARPERVLIDSAMRQFVEKARKEGHITLEPQNELILAGEAKYSYGVASALCDIADHAKMSPTELIPIAVEAGIPKLWDRYDCRPEEPKEGKRTRTIELPTILSNLPETLRAKIVSAASKSKGKFTEEQVIESVLAFTMGKVERGELQLLESQLSDKPKVSPAA